MVGLFSHRWTRGRLLRCLPVLLVALEINPPQMIWARTCCQPCLWSMPPAGPSCVASIAPPSLWGCCATLRREIFFGMQKIVIIAERWHAGHVLPAYPKISSTHTDCTDYTAGPRPVRSPPNLLSMLHEDLAWRGHDTINLAPLQSDRSRG